MVAVLNCFGRLVEEVSRNVVVLNADIGVKNDACGGDAVKTKRSLEVNPALSAGVVDNGLVGKVDTLIDQVGNLESQIANDILPNLGQTPGINKPGLEFNHDLATIQYQSPLADD